MLFSTPSRATATAVLAALNPGEYSDEAWGEWLLLYGTANMTARRLMAEIG